MSSKEQTHSKDKAGLKQSSPKPASENLDILTQQQTHLTTLIQRAKLDPRSLTSSDMLQLQGTIGNQAIDQFLARTTDHQLNGIRSAEPNSIVQRAIIIGAPLDGSYYNTFSVTDAHNHIMHRNNIELNAEDALERLQQLDASPRQNYTGWDELEQVMMEAPQFTDDDKEDIDEEAFQKAKGATEHLIPLDMKVEWQYGGNIAEATTRFVKNNTGGLPHKIVIDVNPEDDYEDYSQINYRRRLGQRTTMFIHELAYHGNKEAYQRFRSNTDDPDYDHRSIFLRETRDKYLTGFLHGLLNQKSTTDEKRALIESWYQDVKFHIKEYKENDEEGEEALEWLEDTKEEMDATML